MRRWEGKSKAEKKEAVRKNLVSVSGKLSKEIKAIQLSSDLSLSLQIKPQNQTRKNPTNKENPKTVFKGKKINQKNQRKSNQNQTQMNHQQPNLNISLAYNM